MHHSLYFGGVFGLPFAQGPPHGRVQLHHFPLLFDRRKGLFPGRKSPRTDQTSTEGGGGAATAVGTMNQDIAPLMCCDAKLSSLLQLIGRWRHSIPTFNQQIFLLGAGFWKLTGQIDGPSPSSAQLMAISATHPPSRFHFICWSNTGFSVPLPLQLGVHQGGAVEAHRTRWEWRLTPRPSQADPCPVSG